MICVKKNKYFYKTMSDEFILINNIITIDKTKN